MRSSVAEDQPVPPPKSHVEALDGLRGVAAIVVMLHHAKFGNSHGFLAVDFFFCLSGFVIAMAYERKLAEGLGFGRYVALRLFRIYPMIVVGALFGLLLAAGNPETAGLRSLGELAVLRAFGAHLLLIPFAGQSMAYVLNNAHWSIAYELAVNAFHGAFARWLTDRVVFGLIAVCGAILIGGGLSVGTIHLGFDQRYIGIALARTGYSFFVGVLIFRHRGTIAAALPKVGFWFLAGALVVLATIHNIERPFAWLEPVRQLGTAMVLNPLIVALGLKCGASGRVVRWLGAASYPLYAIHVPLIYWALYAMTPLFSGLALKAVMLAWCVPVLLLALLLGLGVDRPLNRVRKRRFG